ncbi:chemotaxis protein CheD [Caulobacter sp. NIBR1757]|uniref:chemotaxis protein CheD n=1 Tax=Caulobacter sp. NIBR1757 TaxID=3016000 RepID=UPI0022F079D6|nr:chemotaxis protein CheD [Caulobacter sp. NIBR1757]WGM38327.1 Chemoreceptor glutamine deamidase CheD [Caulobacter sp. NIBR1757]
MSAEEIRKHIVQGDQLVTADKRVVVSTILGSCVAACLRDPVAGVGGMNHFLLPGGAGQTGRQYGVYAMELLINDLLRQGAQRGRMQGRLFGGARMLQGLTDIGSQNGAFAIQFLQDEGIAHVGGSLGGEQARRVQFWPVEGRTRQQLLAGDKSAFGAERRPRPAPVSDGDLELFGAD